MRRPRDNAMAWGGVLLFVVWTMGPVIARWSVAVLGPFGGIDPMLQLGILQWSAEHWWQPQVWLNLPIFYPLTGMLGCMDSLLGQAWLIWPLHILLRPTAAAQYNWAFLGSLLLTAGGMATLWRVSVGDWKKAGVATLALIGAPYTTAQLGHLNQLPPPLVLFTLAAVLAALRGQGSGRSAGRLWWLVGGCLAMQAAWGWYGFAYALVGTATLLSVWFFLLWRRGSAVGHQLLVVFHQAWLPLFLTIPVITFLALPQLQLHRQYPDFTRSATEVRLGSADIQHLANRGAYRSRISDWTGHGVRGPARYQGWARQTLHPGWVALLLGFYGWWRRGELAGETLDRGRALLVLGVVGLVLAFGDSVGIPGASYRLPLPLAWLRAVAPPFRAFRGAWRFSWLMTIAVAWWAAVGCGMLARLPGRRRQLAPLSVVLMAWLSLPVGVPVVPVAVTGWPLVSSPPLQGPVLTLPAPVNEYAEDQTEALWIARAQEIGGPVTGGATGWVPPEIIALRQQMSGCEKGTVDVEAFLVRMRRVGIARAEIAMRPGDETRASFWDQALLVSGAVQVAGDSRRDYRSYVWPDPGPVGGPVAGKVTE